MEWLLALLLCACYYLGQLAQHHLVDHCTDFTENGAVARCNGRCDLDGVIVIILDDLGKGKGEEEEGGV